MDYLKIVIFIEFLLIGFYSLSLILNEKFGKLFNLNGLIVSYSIFIILINYLYFKLNLNINIIFWFIIALITFFIIYNFIYNKNKIIRGLGIVFKISFIPLLIFFFNIFCLWRTILCI